MKAIKEKHIVIFITIIAFVFFAIFMVLQFGSDKPVSNGVEQVIVSDTGEASNINFDTPSNANIEVEKSTLISEYEKRRLDSIAKLNESQINLSSAEMNNTSDNVTQNDILFSDKKEIVSSADPYKNSAEWTSNANKSSATYSNSYDEQAVEENNNINLKTFFDKTPEEKTSQVDNTIANKTDALIYGVIHKDQIVSNNSRVIIRLTKPAVINNRLYKENMFVFGFVRLADNRVLIDIPFINEQEVNLKVYDSYDKNLGLYVEGLNITGEIGKGAINEGLNDVNTSGIPFGGMVKSILKNKTKVVKADLLNNHQIFIKVN